MNTLPYILHVEDAPEQQELVRLLLEPVCSLQQAASLQEASQLIQQQVFDLVLLDLQLPDGNGQQLIDLIKQRAGSTRIALHTADEQPDIADHVDCVISKTDTPIMALRDKVLAVLQA